MFRQPMFLDVIVVNTYKSEKLFDNYKITTGNIKIRFLDCKRIVSSYGLFILKEEPKAAMKF